MKDFIHPAVAKKCEAIIATHNAHNHTFVFGKPWILDCPCGRCIFVLKRRDENAKVTICDCGDWHSILFK